MVPSHLCHIVMIFHWIGATAWVDLVSQREERFQGTGKKIKLPYEGPYKVLTNEGNNEYTIQKVGKEVRLKMQVIENRSHVLRKCHS